MSASLVAIVEVDWDDRVRCQAHGCGKAVQKRVHVVRDDDRVIVVGSDCWARIYADIPGTSSKPSTGLRTAASSARRSGRCYWPTRRPSSRESNKKRSPRPPLQTPKRLSARAGGGQRCGLRNLAGSRPLSIRTIRPMSRPRILGRVLVRARPCGSGANRKHIALPASFSLTYLRSDRSLSDGSPGR